MGMLPSKDGSRVGVWKSREAVFACTEGFGRSMGIRVPIDASEGVARSRASSITMSSSVLSCAAPPDSTTGPAGARVVRKNRVQLEDLVCTNICKSCRGGVGRRANAAFRRAGMSQFRCSCVLGGFGIVDGWMPHHLEWHHFLQDRSELPCCETDPSARIFAVADFILSFNRLRKVRFFHTRGAVVLLDSLTGSDCVSSVLSSSVSVSPTRLASPL